MSNNSVRSGSGTPPASSAPSPASLNAWKRDIDAERAAMDLHESQARHGWMNAPAHFVMDLFSKRGKHSDKAVEKADQFIEHIESNPSKLTGESLGRAQELMARAQNDLHAYDKAKGHLGGIVGSLASVAGTIALSPCGIVGVSIGSAVGNVIGRGIMEGGRYDWQQALRAAATGAIAGGVGFGVGGLVGRATGLVRTEATAGEEGATAATLTHNPLRIVGRQLGNLADRFAPRLSANATRPVRRAVARGIRGVGTGLLAGTAAGGISGMVKNGSAPWAYEHGVRVWATGVLRGGFDGAVHGAEAGALSGGLVMATGLGRAPPLASESQASATTETGPLPLRGLYQRINKLTPGERVGIAAGLAPTKAQLGVDSILGRVSAATQVEHPTPASRADVKTRKRQIDFELKQLEVAHGTARQGFAAIAADVLSGQGGQTDKSLDQARLFIHAMENESRVTPASLDYAQALLDQAHADLEAYLGQSD